VNDILMHCSCKFLQQCSGSVVVVVVWGSGSGSAV